MRKSTGDTNRRSFLKSSVTAVTVGTLAYAFGAAGAAQDRSSGAVPLFDGKTLDGWVDLENSTIFVSRGDFRDLAGLAKKLTEKSDPVSLFIAAQLTDADRADLAAFSATSDVKAVGTELAQDLSKLIAGPSIYERSRFQSVTLRPETQTLLVGSPQGMDLTRVNKMLLEDAYPAEIAQGVATGWAVKDGVIASTGVGRGVLYTANDYGHFRLTFTLRHVSGSPDHDPCVLFFCTRPVAGQMPLDALGGIQFQMPHNWRWDYRPGKNNDGGAEFATVTKSTFDPHQWFRVEILADAAAGTARIAVAQPLGSKAVELMSFSDSTAGKVGPIALQMHNAGLFDEYKDITIETNPMVNDLISVK